MSYAHSPSPALSDGVRISCTVEPPNFSVRAEHVPAARYTISVEGQIDLNTTREVERALLVALDYGVDELVVDLTATSFVDAGFLASLGLVAKLLGDRDGSLSVVCVEPGMRRCLGTSGLGSLILTEPASQEAEPSTVAHAEGGSLVNMQRPAERSSGAHPGSDGAW